MYVSSRRRKERLESNYFAEKVGIYIIMATTHLYIYSIILPKCTYSVHRGRCGWRTAALPAPRFPSPQNSPT